MGFAAFFAELSREVDGHFRRAVPPQVTLVMARALILPCSVLPAARNFGRHDDADRLDSIARTSRNRLIYTCCAPIPPDE